MVAFKRLRRVVHYAATSFAMPVRLLLGQRALIKLLIRRDMVARTSGTLLGGVWMVVQPALQILGLWFFLDIVLRVRSAGSVSFVNYFLVGMIAWTMISEILQRNLTVMVEFGPLYQRTIFPLPLLPLLPMLVSGAIYGTVLVAVSALLEGPLAGLAAAICTIIVLIWLIPLGYLLAVLGLFIREARQVVPFALTLILYLTPILYMPDQLPPALRSWSALNPLADVMVLLHAAVQGQSWTWGNLSRPLMLWLLLMPTAWTLFKRTELHMREAL